MHHWNKPADDGIPGASNSKLSRCTYPGCEKSTSGWKPFCFEHIEELPNVRDVMFRIEKWYLEQRDLELRRVDPDGILATDLFRNLKVRGALNVYRVRALLEIDFALAKILCEELAKRGFLKVVSDRNLTKAYKLPTVCSTP